MDPVTGLSLGRIAIGVGAIASPRLTARMFGLRPSEDTQGALFTRLFGVREIALGALTLVSKGDVRRTLVIAGVAVDSGDAATGVIGLARKEIPVLAGGMLVAVALGAAGSGAGSIGASS
jgi:hypothetical protein